MTFATRPADTPAAGRPDNQNMPADAESHVATPQSGAQAGQPAADDDESRQAQTRRGEAPASCADPAASGQGPQGDTALRPSDWTRTLAAYRQPIPSRSVFELTVTLVPFVAIWAVAWWLVSISALLAMALALANAAFLIRLLVLAD